MVYMVEKPKDDVHSLLLVDHVELDVDLSPW